MEYFRPQNEFNTKTQYKPSHVNIMKQKSDLTFAQATIVPWMISPATKSKSKGYHMAFGSG